MIVRTESVVHHNFFADFILGAIVGLEQTFFRVSEGVGMVELCANVSSPAIDCPITFAFTIILSSKDGTASM